MHYFFIYQEKAFINDREFIMENLDKFDSCFRNSFAEKKWCKKCPHLNHKHLPKNFTSNKIYSVFQIKVDFLLLLLLLLFVGLRVVYVELES